MNDTRKSAGDRASVEPLDLDHTLDDEVDAPRTATYRTHERDRMCVATRALDPVA